jgi:antitoxin VapB
MKRSKIWRVHVAPSIEGEIRKERMAEYVKHLDNAVVLIPEYDSWQPLIDSLSMFSDDFMVERNQPPGQPREDLFE